MRGDPHLGSFLMKYVERTQRGSFLVLEERKRRRKERYQWWMKRKNLWRVVTMIKRMNLRIPHPRMMTMMVMMMVVEEKNMRSQKIERLTVIVLNGQSRSRRRRTSQSSISLDQFLMSVKADVPVVLFHLFSKLLLCGLHFLLSHPTRVIRL